MKILNGNLNFTSLLSIANIIEEVFVYYYTENGTINAARLIFLKYPLSGSINVILNFILYNKEPLEKNS